MIPYIISFAFAGYVAYVAQPGSSLFSWHPTFMSLAFTVLVTQGVLMLSPTQSLLGNYASRGKKVIGHWVLMLGAVVAALSGFAAIYFTKEKFGRPHFATPHGQVGLAVVIYLLVQCLAGANILFPSVATKVVPLGTLKRMHGFSGLFLVFLATLAVLGGLSSDWFKEHGTGVVWYLCLASPVVLWGFLVKQVLWRSRGATNVKSDKKRL